MCVVKLSLYRARESERENYESNNNNNNINKTMKSKTLKYFLLLMNCCII